MSIPASVADPLLKSHGLSDQGRQRQDNQDRLIALERQGFGIYAVIDGVGGYAGGDRAAQIAQERLEQRLMLLNDPPDRMLREAVVAANNAIYEARQQDPRFGAMACVLTVALVHPAQQWLYFAHVGDTRLYRYRQGELTKLTRDHSFVGMREDSGQISEAEAMAHPRRNEILAQVGERPYTVENAEFLDQGEADFIPGDVLLLCSDGLTDLVPRAAITDIIQTYPAPEKMAQWLVEAANDAGGKDNITVVVARYATPQQTATTPAQRPYGDTQTLPPRYADSLSPAPPSSLPATVPSPAAPGPPRHGWGHTWQARTLMVIAGFLVLGALTALLLVQTNLLRSNGERPDSIRTQPARTLPSLQAALQAQLTNPPEAGQVVIRLDSNRAFQADARIEGTGAFVVEGHNDTLQLAPGRFGFEVGPGITVLELRDLVVRSDSFATLLRVQDSTTQVVLRKVVLVGPITPVAGPVYNLRFGPIQPAPSAVPQPSRPRQTPRPPNITPSTRPSTTEPPSPAPVDTTGIP